MMQFKEFNVKSILALFIIVYGMIALVFVHMEDMVLGAIIGFIGVPLSYFFGASKTPGNTNIKDSNVQLDLPPDPDPEEPIQGGGTKNDPPSKKP